MSRMPHLTTSTAVDPHTVVDREGTRFTATREEWAANVYDARLADDDRLPQNRDKVAARNHSDLVRIIDALQRVTTTIGQPAN